MKRIAISDKNKNIKANEPPANNEFVETMPMSISIDFGSFVNKLLVMPINDPNRQIQSKHEKKNPIGFSLVENINTIAKYSLLSALISFLSSFFSCL